MHGFVQKFSRFLTFFFFRQYRQVKCVLRFSSSKEPLFQAIKRRSLRSRKIAILPKRLTHCFNQEMAIFPTYFFSKLGQENVFYDILERKNAFLGYKNKKFKQSKIDIFPKGLTRGFGPIMAIFQSFPFLSIQARKMSFMIFQNQKYAFLGYKKKKIKKAKN